MATFLLLHVYAAPPPSAVDVESIHPAPAPIPPPPEAEIKEGSETPPVAVLESREQVAMETAAAVEEGQEKEGAREDEEEGGAYACILIPSSIPSFSVLHSDRRASWEWAWEQGCMLVCLSV